MQECYSYFCYLFNQSIVLSHLLRRSLLCWAGKLVLLASAERKPIIAMILFHVLACSCEDCLWDSVIQ